MSIAARIKYHLSERGRRDALRQNQSSAHRIQEMDGAIEPGQVDAFSVDEDGRVFFDATVGPFFATNEKWHGFVVNRKVVKARTQYDVEWDIAPSWDDLLEFVESVRQWEKKANEEQAEEAETEERRAREIAEAFLNDPTARASKVAEDYVEIGGETFWGDDICAEAKERWARDQDEIRRKNRATLATWINGKGTVNQRERLKAGVLPWKEAHACLEEHLYSALDGFPLYRRFEIEEVCVCELCGNERCKLQFQSVDASELTADEWGRLAQIRAAAPDATFQLREHRAKCASSAEPVIRRGVIVKFIVDNLTFKREFALTEGGAHDDVRV